MEDSSPNAPLAVVTGASSGIGFELAREFAERGYDLVVAADDAGIQPAADALRATARGDGHVRVEAVRVDLAHPDGVDGLYGRIHALGRPVDVVAINAGVAVGGPFVETDLAAELHLIDLNVTSSVRLAKRAVREMAARGAGRILFTSSIAAEGPAPYLAVYAASKAFLSAFAESIRYELRDAGVSVTVLEPGATNTPIFERSGMADTKTAAEAKTDPTAVAKAGVEALLAGKDRVVAGSLVERLAVAAGHLIPDALKAAPAAKMSEPGSA